MQHPALPALADPVFAARIPPEAAVPHPAWERARAALLAALDAGGPTVLLGQPGSGKTLLLRNVALALSRSGVATRMAERADALDAADDGTVLLVDEADALRREILATLCARRAGTVLAMLPGSAARLAHEVRRVTLEPLGPDDVAAYVAERLAAAARPRYLLDPDAVQALAVRSGGLVRLVNVLGGAAVFLAGLDGSARVLARHVDEAAAMRDDFDAVPAPADAAVACAPVQNVPDAPAPVWHHRAAEFRRRAALSGMFASAALLFAGPFLAMRGRHPEDVQAVALPAGPEGAPYAAADSIQPPVPEPSSAIQDAAAPPPAEQAYQPARDAGAAVASADARPAPSAGIRPVPLPDAPVLFQGPIYNDTMGQGGHVTLVIRKRAPTGAITARFNASQGLSGAGVLAGRVLEGGRIVASGQLLMGKNPFMCDLSGTMQGDTLTGSASFMRDGSGRVYRSRFTLVRT